LVKSTLERWYYAARRSADPVASLRDRLRGNIGRFPSLLPAAVEGLTRQYREHPGWTAQLHFDNLRVALASSDTPLPSYPTVRRYLKAQGMFRQARPIRATDGALLARDRLDRLEVRSFEVDHVSALWHLDFHHAKRKVLTRTGIWVKPLLLGVILTTARGWSATCSGISTRRPRASFTAVASLHEARIATRPDDRPRRRHAGR
jgi:putative transposase